MSPDGGLYAASPETCSIVDLQPVDAHAFDSIASTKRSVV